MDSCHILPHSGHFSLQRKDYYDSASAKLAITELITTHAGERMKGGKSFTHTRKTVRFSQKKEKEMSSSLTEWGIQISMTSCWVKNQTVYHYQKVGFKKLHVHALKMSKKTQDFRLDL